MKIKLSEAKTKLISEQLAIEPSELELALKELNEAEWIDLTPYGLNLSTSPFSLDNHEILRYRYLYQQNGTSALIRLLLDKIVAPNLIEYCKDLTKNKDSNTPNLFDNYVEESEKDVQETVKVVHETRLRIKLEDRIAKNLINRYEIELEEAPPGTPIRDRIIWEETFHYVNLVKARIGISQHLFDSDLKANIYDKIYKNLTSKGIRIVCTGTGDVFKTPYFLNTRLPELRDIIEGKTE